MWVSWNSGSPLIHWKISWWTHFNFFGELSKLWLKWTHPFWYTLLPWDPGSWSKKKQKNRFYFCPITHSVSQPVFTEEMHWENWIETRWWYLWHRHRRWRNKWSRNDIGCDSLWNFSSRRKHVFWCENNETQLFCPLHKQSDYCLAETFLLAK